MTRGGLSNTPAPLARQARLGACGTAVLALVALAALCVALSGCTAATKPGPPAEDTPVTVIATAAAAPSAALAEPPATQHSLSMRGFNLVFDDEFNGSVLNRRLWEPSLPWGNTNRAEQQYYTPQALSLRDGALVITARRQQRKGKPFTSGVITSDQHFKFAYGFAEIRARVPAGAGLWSAFWLVVRQRGSNEEADIVEVLGRNPTQGYAVLHYGTMIKKEINVGSYTADDLSVGWHTFALDWQPGSMIWYVDGVERQRLTQGVPSSPMVIIANLAVGSPQSWSGPPDATTPFPANYRIDYIRVFQRK